MISPLASRHLGCRARQAASAVAWAAKQPPPQQCERPRRLIVPSWSSTQEKYDRFPMFVLAAWFGVDDIFAVRESELNDPRIADDLRAHYEACQGGKVSIRLRVLPARDRGSTANSVSRHVIGNFLIGGAWGRSGLLGPRTLETSLRVFDDVLKNSSGSGNWAAQLDARFTHREQRRPDDGRALTLPPNLEYWHDNAECRCMADFCELYAAATAFRRANAGPQHERPALNAVLRHLPGEVARVGAAPLRFIFSVASGADRAVASHSMVTQERQRQQQLYVRLLHVPTVDLLHGCKTTDMATGGPEADDGPEEDADEGVAMPSPLDTEDYLWWRQTLFPRQQETSAAGSPRDGNGDPPINVAALRIGVLWPVTARILVERGFAETVNPAPSSAGIARSGAANAPRFQHLRTAVGNMLANEDCWSHRLMGVSREEDVSGVSAGSGVPPLSYFAFAMMTLRLVVETIDEAVSACNEKVPPRIFPVAAEAVLGYVFNDTFFRRLRKLSVGVHASWEGAHRGEAVDAPPRPGGLEGMSLLAFVAFQRFLLARAESSTARDVAKKNTAAFARTELSVAESFLLRGLTDAVTPTSTVFLPPVAHWSLESWSHFIAAAGKRGGFPVSRRLRWALCREHYFLSLVWLGRAGIAHWLSTQNDDDRLEAQRTTALLRDLAATINSITSYAANISVFGAASSFTEDDAFTSTANPERHDNASSAHGDEGGLTDQRIAALLHASMSPAAVDKTNDLCVQRALRVLFPPAGTRRLLSECTLFESSSTVVHDGDAAALLGEPTSDTTTTTALHDDIGDVSTLVDLLTAAITGASSIGKAVDDIRSTFSVDAAVASKSRSLGRTKSSHISPLTVQSEIVGIAVDAVVRATQAAQLRKLSLLSFDAAGWSSFPGGTSSTTAECFHVLRCLLVISGFRDEFVEYICEAIDRREAHATAAEDVVPIAIVQWLAEPRRRRGTSSGSCSRQRRPTVIGGRPKPWVPVDKLLGEMLVNVGESVARPSLRAAAVNVVVTWGDATLQEIMMLNAINASEHSTSEATNMSSGEVTEASADSTTAASMFTVHLLALPSVVKALVKMDVLGVALSSFLGNGQASPKVAKSRDTMGVSTFGDRGDLAIDQGVTAEEDWDSLVSQCGPATVKAFTWQCGCGALNSSFAIQCLSCTFTTTPGTGRALIPTSTSSSTLAATPQYTCPLCLALVGVNSAWAESSATVAECPHCHADHPWRREAHRLGLWLCTSRHHSRYQNRGDSCHDQSCGNTASLAANVLPLVFLLFRKGERCSFCSGEDPDRDGLCRECGNAARPVSSLVCPKCGSPTPTKELTSTENDAMSQPMASEEHAYALLRVWRCSAPAARLPGASVCGTLNLVRAWRRDYFTELRRSSVTNSSSSHPSFPLLESGGGESATAGNVVLHRCTGCKGERSRLASPLAVYFRWTCPKCDQLNSPTKAACFRCGCDDILRWWVQSASGRMEEGAPKGQQLPLQVDSPMKRLMQEELLRAVPAGPLGRLLGSSPSSVESSDAQPPAGETLFEWLSPLPTRRPDDVRRTLAATPLGIRRFLSHVVVAISSDQRDLDEPTLTGHSAGGRVKYRMSPRDATLLSKARYAKCTTCGCVTLADAGRCPDCASTLSGAVAFPEGPWTCVGCGVAHESGCLSSFAPVIAVEDDGRERPLNDGTWCHLCGTDRPGHHVVGQVEPSSLPASTEAAEGLVFSEAMAWRCRHCGTRDNLGFVCHECWAPHDGLAKRREFDGINVGASGGIAVCSCDRCAKAMPIWWSGEPCPWCHAAGILPATSAADDERAVELQTASSHHGPPRPQRGRLTSWRCRVCHRDQPPPFDLCSNILLGTTSDVISAALEVECGCAHCGARGAATFRMTSNHLSTEHLADVERRLLHPRTDVEGLQRETLS